METTSSTQLGMSTLPTKERSGPDWVHRLARMAHQGIDRAEQGLNSAGGMSGGQAEKAREYVGQARERAADQPGKAAALVFASGFVFSRLFMRKPKPRIVKVPVYVPQRSRTMDRAGSGAQDLMHRLGAAALKGMGAAKAMTAAVPHQARGMTSNLRSATQSVGARTQAYGERARSSMQEHPVLGTSLALGAGALLAKQLMPERYQGSSMASSSRASFLDRSGASSSANYGGVEGPFRFGGSGISSRTMMLSGAGLGVGVLLGAVLMRR